MAEPNIAIDPQEDQNVEQGLIPNPYTATQEQMEKGVVQPTVREGIAGMQEPQEDEMTRLRNEELAALDRADYFIDFQGNKKTWGVENASRKQKLDYILAYQGAYLPKYDDQGNRVNDRSQKMDEQGQPLVNDQGMPVYVDKPSYHALSWLQNYEYMTGERSIPTKMIMGEATPVPEKGKVETVVGAMRSGILDRGAPGDLKERDERLKEAGIENPLARAAILRKIATGADDRTSTMATRDLQDVGVTLITAPKAAPATARFLISDLVMPLAEGTSQALFGTTLDDKTRISEDFMKRREAIDKTLGAVTDFFDLAHHLGMQTFVEERKGKLYRPEVIEGIWTPATATEAGARYGLTEAAFYSVYGAYKVLGAARQLPKFTKFLTDKYGGEDFVEAFANAYKANDKNLTDVLLDYRKTFTNKKMEERASKQLDTLLQLWSVRPSSTRNKALKGEFDMIDQELRDSRRLLEAAKKTNNPKVAAREEAKIKSLDERRKTLLHDNFTPKFIRDAGVEMGLTTGFTVTSTQVMQSFYGAGNDDLMIPEIASALLVAPVQIAGKKLDARELGMNIARMADRYALSHVVGFAKSIGYDGKAFSLDGYKAYRAGKKVDSKVSDFFRDLNKLNPQFQEMIMQGLKNHARTRDMIVELSAKTGVDMDADMMISNLAKMSEVSYLMDFAQQLDSKIIATGLGDVDNLIVDRSMVSTQQRLLVAQMALASRQLLKAKAAANLADDSELGTLAKRMQQFVMEQNARLDADDAFISGLQEMNKEVFESMSKTQLLDVDAPERTVGFLRSDYMARLEKMRRNVSPEILDNVEDPVAHVAKTFEELEVAAQENFEQIKRLSKGVRVDEAQAGAASTTWGYFFARKAFNVDRAVDAKYATWEAKNSDVHADVSTQFDEMFAGDPSTTNMDNWDFYLDQSTTGIKEASGYRFIGATQRGFASMFDAAAARTLEGMDRFAGGEQAFKGMLVELKLDGQSAISQWKRLREYAKNPALLEQDGIEATDELLSALPQFADMPLLVTAKEWRDANRHLGKLTRSANDLTADRYWLAYRNWQVVSDPESKAAFARGWINKETGSVGMPENVADEVYAEFRDAQNFYRVERVQRYNTNRSVRGMNDVLDTRTKKAAEGEDQADFLAGMGGVEDDKRPNYWINNLYKRLKKDANAPGAGNGLKGTQLEDSIGGALGSGFGMYDPKTNRFVLVTESVDDMDAESIEIVDHMRHQMQLHLQGILRDQFDKVMPEVGGATKFAPFDNVEWDEKTFNSLFNIPTYAKQADGTMVQNGFLFNREEVFEILSLDELERVASDPKMVGEGQKKLQGMLRQANEAVAKLDNAIDEGLEFTDNFGNQVNLHDKIRSDITFANDLQKEFFGTMTRGTAEGVAISRTKKDVDQAIFNAFIDGDDPDKLVRLKSIMEGKGYSAEQIDEFIARSINDHLIENTHSYTGKTFNTTADGMRVVDVPEREIDSSKIYEMIGAPDSTRRKNMNKVMGEDVVNTWERIAQAVDQVNPKVERTGLDANIASMSLDSILSRIYNINRGVVSVQWVATESIIRAARQKSGALLKAMLSDREFAGMVLDVIETGKVPKYAVETEAWRVLLTEAMYQEGINDAALSTPAVEYYYDLTGVSPTKEQQRRERYEVNEYTGIDEAPQPQPEQAKKPTRTYTPAEQDLIKLGINPDVLKEQ